MHFSVAVDVLLIAVGLFCVALLSYVLPITIRGISTGKYFAFVSFAWNLTSLIAIAAATGIAIFAPETKLNRRRTKIWLMFALVCQSILGLLPNADAMATLIRTLWPGWLGIFGLIVLLHLESRIRKSDWRAIADAIRKPSLPQNLKNGGVKIFFVAMSALAITFSVLHARHLEQSIQTQLASRAWPTTGARLIECNTLESDTLARHHFFDLEYQFDVGFITFTGNDYDMLHDKPYAYHFNAAQATVAEINAAKELRVAYNPADPSQSLLLPGITANFVLASFLSFAWLSVCLIVLVTSWRMLMKRRFNDQHRVGQRKTGFFAYANICALTTYVCSSAFTRLAHIVPIETWLFGALWLTIAVLLVCCFKQRVDADRRNFKGSVVIRKA